MKLSNEDVRDILSIIESSDFDTIEIKVGDIQIAASKSGKSLQPGAASTTQAVQDEEVRLAPETASVPQPREPTKDTGEEGLVEITAPIVGIFYIAREPGAAPFVKAGDRIEADTPVGIIEVMKVFNDVRAEVKGEVVRCLVEDGEFVEFKQPIFLIRPEA